MRGRKILALVVCMVMVLAALPQVALGAPEAGTLNVSINGSEPESATLYEFGGYVEIPIYVSGNTQISKIIPKNVVDQPLDYATYNYEGDGKIKVEENQKLVLVRAKVNDTGDADKAALSIYYSDGANNIQKKDIGFILKTTTGSSSGNGDGTGDGTDGGDTSGGIIDTTATPEPDKESPILLMLSPTAPDGTAITAPSGNGGDSLRVRIPIRNRGSHSFDAIATHIIVTPQLSSSLDNFPFDVEAIDYSRSLPDMRPGEVQEVVYNFRISKEATSGVKEVKFNCVYYHRQKKTYETATFSVFVTVIKGKEEEKEIKDGDELLATQPKIIVESMSLVPDEPQPGDEEGRLYAGELFTLTMQIRNTSSEEAVKNIQVTLSNEGNVIIPANNASNSFYIARIEPGQSVERAVQLQSAPDAEPKSQTLKVEFAYESSKTLKGYTVSQDIAVPITQRVRVRLNDPMMYGDGMVEQPMNVSLTMLNLSKSTLYYCSVEVEGEGLRLEEPVYYGNVSGGGTMGVDFNIIPSISGDVTGTFVVTYEDAYNQQTRVEKEFTFYVMEDMMSGGEEMMFPGGMEGMEPGGFEEPPSEGLPTWLVLTLSGGAILLLLGLLVMIRRRRRKRELTAGL